MDCPQSLRLKTWYCKNMQQYEKGRLHDSWRKSIVQPFFEAWAHCRQLNLDSSEKVAQFQIQEKEAMAMACITCLMQTAFDYSLSICTKHQTWNNLVLKYGFVISTKSSAMSFSSAWTSWNTWLMAPHTHKTLLYSSIYIHKKSCLWRQVVTSCT